MRAAFRERLGVPDCRLAGDHVHADAADARCCPGEVAVNNRLMQADRLKLLRPAVAFNGRNAHFGHNFDNALDNCLAVVLFGVIRRNVAQQVLPNGVINRFQSKIRINRGDAVADQKRKVMHFARLTGLQDQANARPRLLPYQMVMQSCCRQQSRDRGHFRVDVPVRQHQDVFAFGNGLIRRRIQRVHCRYQAFRTIGGTKHNRQRDGLKAGPLDLLQLRQIFISENG